VELSSEDLLRLNVLLAQDCEAIRIDEPSLTVFGLARGSEACVPLNPNCRAERYLRGVREFLSSFALGSPGGYPVFLQRWTRMGQAKGGQLEKLLLLGEPEAVVAVAGAPDITGELARRVWWSQPTSDNARRMLERDTVVASPIGKVLAEFLVEYLPFETDPLTVINTVKLVLQPGLIAEDIRQRIWSRGTHRNAYHLGFLDANPNDLPNPLPARADFNEHRTTLQQLADAGNGTAALLMRVLAGPGQTFLAVSEDQIRHPLDKFTAAHLFEIIGNYFGPVRGLLAADDDVGQVVAAAEAAVDEPRDQGLATLLATAPALTREVRAMLVLGATREALITPIIAQTSATGTVLRRKLEPVTNALLAEYVVLRATAGR
jgi:hypothetical protein